MSKPATPPPSALPAEPAISPRQRLGAVAAVVVLVLAVHGVAVGHAFSPWDDHLLVLGNELLNPVTPAKLARMWSGPVEGLYAPLAYTLWAGASATAGMKPAVFHAINLLLHAGCCVIVLTILLRLTGGHVIAALLGAAVFAVHPLQVEPVAWVSGMNNLLAGVFALGAIAAYLRALHGGRGLSAAGIPGRGAPGRSSPGWYVVALILFLLACLSKPTAIVTPIVLLAVDGLILRRPAGSIVRRLWPFVVIAGVFAVIGRIVQPPGGTFNTPLPWRPLVAVDAIGFYLQKVLVPWPLYIDYGRTPQQVMATGLSLWPTAALLVAVAAVIVFRRRRWVAASLAVFVGAMTPVIGLVPFEFQNFSTVADRYAYLSMLGVAVLVAFVLSHAGRTAGAIALAVVLVLAGVSVRQSLYWKTGQTLADHQMAYRPDSLAAHAMLGDMAVRRNDLTDAERHMRAFLAVRPQDATINCLLADLLVETNRPGEALQHYQAACDHGLRSASLFNNWGRALWQTGQLSRAADAFREAVARDPDRFNARLNLGMVLANLGQLDESAMHLQRATELDPASAMARDSLARVNALRTRR